VNRGVDLQPARSVSLEGCSDCGVNHSARRWDLKFQMVCPNVKFRARNAVMERYESVGFAFGKAPEDVFWECKHVIAIELNSLEELIALQEKTNVLITLDGTTLIFDAP
jgi:hypothetical protein